MRKKLWYILTQAIEASQASQTISMGQNYFAACCEYCSQEWLLLVREWCGFTSCHTCCRFFSPCFWQYHKLGRPIWCQQSIYPT
jgi:hypothetical protein